MRQFFYRHKSFVQRAAVCLLLGGAFLSVSLPSVQAAVSVPVQPFAQVSIAEEAFRGRFGNRSSRPSNSLVLVVAGTFLATLVLGLFFGDRYFRRFKIKDGYYSRNSLFREICQAHHFTKFQQKLLWDMAKTLRLENPLDLFVEPKYLEQIISKRSPEYPLESLRTIFAELFNDGGVVKETGISKGHDSWFPVTVIAKNPEAKELVYSKGTGTQAGKRAQTSFHSADATQETTRAWDPSLWDEINLIGNGLAIGGNEEPKREEEDNTRPPVYVAPPLKSEVEEMQSQTYHQAMEEKKNSWLATKKQV